MAAQLKTRPTDDSVRAFLEAVEDDRKRKDAYELVALMREVTGEEPRMWGKSIVGFGDYHYKYESGREGDWFLAGFSPRKRSLTVYLQQGFTEHVDLLDRLGKFKTGKGCLYVNKLDDVDRKVLRKLVERSVERKTG